MASEISTDIDRAQQIIRAGGLVGAPTETVYGLAADATNDAAVAQIYAAKKRPRFNPLIVHVIGLAQAETIAHLSPQARTLAEAFWPGPLSLVLPRRDTSGLSLLLSAGLDTVAIRAPAHPMMRALIEASDRPLAAPSANASGAVSPTTAEHVRDGLGEAVDLILDGGPSPIGIESTIVKVDGDAARLLRPGGLARADLETRLGRALLAPEETTAPEAPGMLHSHYAPTAMLRLHVEAPRPEEAYLAFGDAPAHPNSLNLSERRDTTEAAANLFAHLRALDALCRQKGLAGIAAAPIPEDGLGEAINDRLARAAAPREAD